MATSPNPNIDAPEDFLALLESSTSAPTTFAQRVNILLELGAPVVPLQVKSKDPCTAHAALDGTTDPDTIGRWVDKYAAASNCGACASFDGFWMLDDDLGALAATYKTATGLDLPQTFTVKTSRGFHFYFQHDDASRAVRYDGHDNSGVIDIPGYKGEARCHHQYVVGPGSVHPSGTVYEVCNDAPIVTAPTQLLEWLQQAYALSESLKIKSQKAKSNRQVEPGFNKMFDAVGYRPLVKRINSLEDVRLHLHHGIMRGKVIPCPMPQHKHVDYTNCFGSLQDVPELLHCLGNCGWTGDMVAACYEIDGGKTKYKNMYECARAICNEENLNFDEFFPTKAAARPAEPFVETSARPTEVTPAKPPVEIIESAFYGILGRIIHKLQPQTESHPMGNLLELMTSVGSMIGRTAYYQVESTKHFCNLFFVRVGVTARSRKGTGKDRIAEIMNLVNSEWLRDQNISGFGSGEAVIWAIRDKIIGPVQNKRTRQWATEVIDPGVDNKTLHINEGEFVGVLTVASRKDNILSKIIRDGWDGKPLRNTVKTAPCSVMEPYISQACDITQQELLRGLSESDKFNGFANRYLWPYVYRTGEKPHGGDPIDWTAEVRELQSAIDFAHEQGRVRMDRNAKLRWERMYHDLGVDEPGLVGAVTARAEPQVLRMALIFALLDLSAHIKVEHLEAANAVWQYCLQSARFIFGQTVALPGTLTKDQVKLLAFITSGPKNRKQISVDCYKRNKSADGIALDLLALRQQGYINETPDVHGTPIFTVTGSS